MLAGVKRVTPAAVGPAPATESKGVNLFSCRLHLKPTMPKSIELLSSSGFSEHPVVHPSTDDNYLLDDYSRTVTSVAERGSRSVVKIDVEQQRGPSAAGQSGRRPGRGLPPPRLHSD